MRTDYHSLSVIACIRKPIVTTSYNYHRRSYRHIKAALITMEDTAIMSLVQPYCDNLVCEILYYV